MFVDNRLSRFVFVGILMILLLIFPSTQKPIHVVKQAADWSWPPIVMHEPIWLKIPALAKANEFIRQFGRSFQTREKIVLATWRESRILWQHPKTKWIFTDPAEPFFLLLAQQAAESRFNPNAVSPCNRDGSRDLGLAQHNSRYLAKRKITDWRNIDQQVRAQAEFMCSLLQLSARHGGERAIRAALAGYTAGPKWAARGMVPDVGRTRPHVAKIMRYYRQLVPMMPEQTGRYIVRPGDTLWRIAKRFNTTVEELAQRNYIVNPNLIHVGQVLTI